MCTIFHFKIFLAKQLVYSVSLVFISLSKRFSELDLPLGRGQGPLNEGDPHKNKIIYTYIFFNFSRKY